MDDFEVVGRIVIDDSGAASLSKLNSSLDQTGSKAGLVSGAFNSLGLMAQRVFANLITAGIMFATRAFEDFARSVFTEGMDAQNVLADLNAVIKSTGGIAGVTAQAADDLAKSLSGVTAFSDEQILSGENMLLTFTKIGKDIFPQATETMLNLAQKMGTDAPQAAIQLGKALNDPVAGITALHRVGVQFSDAQKKQIDQMVKSGDLMGAQKVILSELATEFGGAARAAGDTFAGKLEILQTKIGNIKESIFNALQPALLKAADLFSAWLDNPTTQANLTKVIKFIGDNLPGALSSAISLVSDLSGYWKGMVGALSRVGDSLSFFGKFWSEHGPDIETQGRRIFLALQNGISQLSAKIGPFIAGALKSFGDWFTKNGPLIERFAKVIADAFINYVIPAVVQLWNVAAPILSGLGSLIGGLATLVMQVATGDWAGAWQTIVGTVTTVLGDIWQAIVGAGKALAVALGGTPNNIGKTWAANWGAFMNIVKWSLGTAYNMAMGEIAKWINIGVNIVNGIRTGIIGAWAGLVSWFTSKLKDLAASAASALKINSPSKVFEEIGLGIPEGLFGGVDKGFGQLMAGFKDNISSLGTVGAAAAGGSVSNSSVSNRSQHFGSINNYYMNQGGDPLATLKNLRGA